MSVSDTYDYIQITHLLKLLPVSCQVFVLMLHIVLLSDSDLKKLECS